MSTTKSSRELLKTNTLKAVEQFKSTQAEREEECDIITHILKSVGHRQAQATGDDCNDDCKDEVCSRSETLQDFVIRRVDNEENPEDKQAQFFRDMLQKYIHADIENRRRNSQQRELESNVCLFAPHVVPLIYEALPLVSRAIDKFDLAQVSNLVGTMLNNGYSRISDAMANGSPQNEEKSQVRQIPIAAPAVGNKSRKPSFLAQSETSSSDHAGVGSIASSVTVCPCDMCAK
jgi:hypothetical protein